MRPLFLSDSGYVYVYLMTSLLFEEPENRAHPKQAKAGLPTGTTSRSRSPAAG